MDIKEVLDYAQWAKDIILLNSRSGKAANRTVKRGQVYKCKLGMGVGSEERKERPCVIIQNNGSNLHSPNVIVAPITHGMSNHPTVALLNPKYDSDGNVVLDGNVYLANIVCVSKARLGDYITTLSSNEMKTIDMAIAKSLDLEHYYTAKVNELEDKKEYINKLKKHIIELEKQIDKIED